MIKFDPGAILNQDKYYGLRVGDPCDRLPSVSVSPMSLASHTTSLVLWCAQPVLQSAALIVLWRRQFQKQFPVFFAYLVAQVVFFAVTFPIYQRDETWYFWLFWLGQAVNAVLGFKVIHEIFLDVFRPYHALKDLGTPVFKWAGVVMLLVSVVVAASNSFTRYPVIHAVTTLQRSVRMVQFGLILFLIIFSRFLGVSRKQLSFGIALGFGGFAGTELMLLAIFSGGFVGRNSFNFLNMLLYDASIVVWLVYAFVADVSRETSINHLRTQRWEKGIADIQHTASNDSLIPMFETMVERAFSRSSNIETSEETVPSPELPPRRSKSAAAGSDRHP